MDIETLKSMLADLDTASICDADKAIRVMGPDIRPLRTGLILLGFARTVRAGGDFLTVLKALKDAVPGEVLVIDPQGARCAVAGEMFSTEACRKGLAGMVIDGACRDTRRIRDLPSASGKQAEIPVERGAPKSSLTATSLQIRRSAQRLSTKRSPASNLARLSAGRAPARSRKSARRAFCKS
ncbi:MAG TPA: RraA family protein [Thermoanaerobaculia bacterium]|jgi:regulator of RNase E activity RraA|nr:RraA family protein [Thermoanaerobaculia bacterium]